MLNITQTRVNNNLSDKNRIERNLRIFVISEVLFNMYNIEMHIITFD